MVSFATLQCSRIPLPYSTTWRRHQHSRTTTRLKATSSDEVEATTKAEEAVSPPPTKGKDDTDFEERFTKWRVGKGKKAEMKRLRKQALNPSRKKKGIFLPPVPLKEPASGELKVELGFNPYSERLNGRLAILGLAALVLVELYSGKGLLNYHPGPTLIIQVYFILGLSALFVKYEKEKISIWPKSKS